MFYRRPLSRRLKDRHLAKPHRRRPAIFSRQRPGFARSIPCQRHGDTVRICTSADRSCSKVMNRFDGPEGPPLLMHLPAPADPPYRLRGQRAFASSRKGYSSLSICSPAYHGIRTDMFCLGDSRPGCPSWTALRPKPRESAGKHAISHAQDEIRSDSPGLNMSNLASAALQKDGPAVSCRIVVRASAPWRLGSARELYRWNPLVLSPAPERKPHAHKQRRHHLQHVPE